MITVVAGVECPKSADTDATSTPALISRLACKCPNAMKTRSIDNLAVIDKNIKLMTSVVSVQMVNHSKSERHTR